MRWRCRTCGAENIISDTADGFKCDVCGATFTLARVKVVEQEVKPPADPLDGQ